uniref:Uncharacterized protein n=1 Tax=Megaselia scalaris TaxID=36166 RepID=T1GSJ7_MEGSC
MQRKILSQKLANNKIVKTCKESLQDLSSVNSIKLCWVLGHAEIELSFQSKITPKFLALFESLSSITTNISNNNKLGLCRIDTVGFTPYT